MLSERDEQLVLASRLFPPRANRAVTQVLVRGTCVNTTFVSRVISPLTEILDTTVERSFVQVSPMQRGSMKSHTKTRRRHFVHRNRKTITT